MDRLERIHPLIRADKEEIFALGKKMFNTPELGFKEFQTKATIVDYLQKHGFEQIEYYGETGVIVTIGSGKPSIGMIAELDAIPTPSHPQADPKTGAAHTCGHSTQCVIMLEALKVLRQEMKNRPGTIRLYFTPAEEFTDIAFRREYIRSGKAKYFCGKTNMLVDGVFNDSDVLIHLHAMGRDDDHDFSLGSTLAGFTYKEITFHGVASHAAVSPDKGVNALNMFALFQSAVGMLRETFVDEEKVRVHGIVTKGGSTVNSIPDEVIYECYVRGFGQDSLMALSKKIDNAADHCAKALGGAVSIRELPGDLPFYQDKNLNKVIYRNMEKLVSSERILTGEMSVAAGDIGDVSCFFPTIQFGYSGFDGFCHGISMCVKDETMVYLLPADVVVSSVLDLIDHPDEVIRIKEAFRPSITMEDYLKHLNTDN